MAFNPEWPCRVCGWKWHRKDAAEECALDDLRRMMRTPPVHAIAHHLRPAHEMQAAQVRHGAG